MKTRIKVTTTAIRDRAHADTILGEVRLLTLQKQAMTTERDQRVARIDEEIAPTLSTLDDKVSAYGDLLRSWAERNPDEFGNAKSLELTHGKLGFRTGQPKLTKIAKEKWDLMVDKVRAVLGVSYIRTSEEVARDRIISAHSEGLFDNAALRRAGLRVDQDESFFVEPKMEEVETRTVVSAAA